CALPICQIGPSAYIRMVSESEMPFVPLPTRHVSSRMAMIALVGLLALFNGGNASKALTERSHWADNSTGLAIGGFDPVAYFAVARAVRGREGIEHGWNGGGWRFVNDGNRRAFARDPEVYAPRFGGLDPVLLARGR